VFSEGLDTSSWLTRQDVIDRAKRGNAVVYAVSGGALSLDPFLRDITDVTGGSLFEKWDLEDIFVRILKEFRQRYLITYSPQNVQKGGWHRLTVRVKGRKLTTKARAGYRIPL
jgi:hypothetical protein